VGRVISPETRFDFNSQRKGYVVSELLGGAEHFMERKGCRLAGSFECLFGISLLNKACSPYDQTVGSLAGIYGKQV
jgi:hypothetical protein